MRTFNKVFNSHLNNTKVPRKIFFFFKGLNQHFALPANQVLKTQRTWWHSSIKIHGAKIVTSPGMRFHAPSWWVAAVQKQSLLLPPPGLMFLLLPSEQPWHWSDSWCTGEWRDRRHQGKKKKKGGRQPKPCGPLLLLLTIISHCFCPESTPVLHYWLNYKWSMTCWFLLEKNSHSITKFKLLYVSF